MFVYDSSYSPDIIKQTDLAGLSPNRELKDLSYEQICAALRQKSRAWSFLQVVDNVQDLQTISQWTSRQSHRWNTVVILGIGGSALGARMLHRALGHKSRFRVHILDNVDSVTIGTVSTGLELDKTLFLVVSKSGKTPETVAQMTYFGQQLESRGLRPSDHMVCIGDENQEFLMTFAEQNGLHRFFMPRDIGGRFSVLTVVGLVFASLIGLDISALLQGAGLALRDFENPLTEDSSLLLGLSQFALYRGNDLDQTVIFAYADGLQTVADWYIQLLSESIGKKLLRDGRIRSTGLTPIRATGVTDQHSQLQLFAEGPDNKFFIFLSVDEPEVDFKIPPVASPEFGYMSGVTFDGLLKAELEGTRQSLLEAGRSLSHIRLQKLDELCLGRLIMTLQLSVACLGELLFVNAFDQPGVERSKILTRQILSRA